MTPTLNNEIHQHILNAFAIAEARHGIEIPAEDKNFLLSVMPKLFEAHVDKFVTGAVEHHDSPFMSMSPDDMIREALKESSDLPFYIYGYFFSKAARRQAV